eukprot:s321_g12.t1
MSAACRTLADCQNLAEYVTSLTETVDEGKRKELQRMCRPKLMSLIASRVVPEDDVDFLNKIDAMYSTSKDTTEDDDEDDVIVGDFVDELVREVPAMPVPAPGEEPENQVEAEEEGRVPAPPAEVPEVPAMPVPAPGEEPENQVEAEEEGRVPAPPAEVEAEEEGRVPAPPAEVPEAGAFQVRVEFRRLMKIAFDGATERQSAIVQVRLAEAGDIGFGREDILMEAAASVPGKHVELFRKLQAKWQCYDAYSRISMALGVNQMIQSVNYFVVGYTMIQTCSPSNGYAATIIFQGCTFGLAFLDIAGLRSWKIFALQLVGALPMLILVAMLTVANRGRSGSESIALLCPAFYASPLCAYVEALWLELFMLTAKPSDDEASLPRRFRTVLFLDVFGDAAFDPTEAEHAAVTAGVDGKMEELRDDATKREVQQRQAAKAGFALQAAQGALRCWEAVPQELLTGVQASQLQNLRQEYSMWRERYHGCYSKMKSRRGVPYDSAQQDARALRRWDELTPAEQEADEFYQALVGPLQRRADASQSQYYDVSRGCSVWTAPPGVTILDMQMALHRVQEAEYDVQMLLDIERGDLKLQEEKDKTEGYHRV